MYIKLKNNIKSFLIASLILIVRFEFGFAGNVLSPQEQQQFLHEMTTQLADVKNFQAEFEQERHLSIMVEPLISKGMCYFEVPDKLRWEIYSPYSSILIYNKEKVSKFEIDNGQLKKLNFGAVDIMRKVLQQIISWMRGNFTDSEAIYSIKVFQGAINKIQLTPKSEVMRENLKSIELHIKPETFQLEQVLIKESAVDFIRIKFKNKQENLNLPEKIFHLNHPVVVK